MIKLSYSGRELAIFTKCDSNNKKHQTLKIYNIDDNVLKIPSKIKN